MKLIRVVLSALVLSSSAVYADSQQEIQDRLQPVGQVNVAEASTAASGAASAANSEASATGAAAKGRDPKEIYEKFCSTCHAPTMTALPSPKLGDKAEWDKRLLATNAKQGATGTLEDAQVAVLVNSVINGKNAMPPKGMCSDCTTQEFQATVEYMIAGDKK